MPSRLRLRAIAAASTVAVVLLTPQLATAGSSGDRTASVRVTAGHHHDEHRHGHHHEHHHKHHHTTTTITTRRVPPRRARRAVRPWR